MSLALLVYALLACRPVQQAASALLVELPPDWVAPDQPGAYRAGVETFEYIHPTYGYASGPKALGTLAGAGHRLGAAAPGGR